MSLGTPRFQGKKARNRSNLLIKKGSMVGRLKYCNFFRLRGAYCFLEFRAHSFGTLGLPGPAVPISNTMSPALRPETGKKRPKNGAGLTAKTRGKLGPKIASKWVFGLLGHFSLLSRWDHHDCSAIFFRMRLFYLQLRSFCLCSSFSYGGGTESRNDQTQTPISREGNGK